MGIDGEGDAQTCCMADAQVQVVGQAGTRRAWGSVFLLLYLQLLARSRWLCCLLRLLYAHSVPAECLGIPDFGWMVQVLRAVTTRHCCDGVVGCRGICLR